MYNLKADLYIFEHDLHSHNTFAKEFKFQNGEGGHKQ